MTENIHPLILNVGGGNAETVLISDGEIVLGRKHSVLVNELYGGSGVNHALRLIEAGFDALPILAIGNDKIGCSIREQIIRATKMSHTSRILSEFIEESGDNFFDPYIHTSSTTIVVHGAKRTIFTQKLRNGEHFVRHIKRRITDIINSNLPPPAVVMIGHIHSDGKDINRQNPGECSKYVIDSFKGKSVIYANFGNSQINLGYTYWRELLPSIDVFQLNIEEAKRFFSDTTGERKSLTDIVNKLREIKVNAVITLDRFGAIGIHKEAPDSIFFSWPIIHDEDVVDPTGAGDAFAAGMVSHFCKNTDIHSTNFQTAICTAQLWAAYACKTYGGSGECPNQQQLYEFNRKIIPSHRHTLEFSFRDYATELMTVLDIAFK
jgi:sugar/nucleoside kinase (ribokinase family)